MLSRVATITLESIENNALVCLGQEKDIVVDLRADAFGHGLAQVAQVLHAAGIRKCLVRRPTEKAFLEQMGFSVRATDDPIKPFSHNIYGLGDDVNCRAALRLESCVMSSKTLAAGQGISYCHTYRTQTKENVALIGIGYADGLPFQAQGQIEIEGKEYPVVGRIAMDYMVAKLESDFFQHGTKVIVWGKGGAKSWSESSGIDPLCLTAALARRVKKLWIKGDPER